MDGPPPPRRYSRGAYDDDRRGPPPPHYRDDRPPYDHRGPPPPLPPYRGPDRRNDYGYDRGLPPPPLPRRRYDDEGPGGPPPPRGFDRRGGPPDSPDYDGAPSVLLSRMRTQSARLTRHERPPAPLPTPARKRRRSLSPGGPPRGGRPSMDYPPPREYRDGVSLLPRPSMRAVGSSPRPLHVPLQAPLPAASTTTTTTAADRRLAVDRGTAVRLPRRRVATRRLAQPRTASRSRRLHLLLCACGSPLACSASSLSVNDP